VREPPRTCGTALRLSKLPGHSCPQIGEYKGADTGQLLASYDLLDRMLLCTSSRQSSPRLGARGRESRGTNDLEKAKRSTAPADMNTMFFAARSPGSDVQFRPAGAAMPMMSVSAIPGVGVSTG
jgi:hypothetical protein